MPSILVNDEIYENLTKLLEEAKIKTGESTLKRPALIEKMIMVYKEHLGI